MELKETTKNEVDKINLSCQLDGIRDVLTLDDSFDPSYLDGIVNLLRLLQQPQFRDMAKNEFLGPVFQWIKFKEDVEFFSKIYFRVRN